MMVVGCYLSNVGRRICGQGVPLALQCNGDVEQRTPYARKGRS